MAGGTRSAANQSEGRNMDDERLIVEVEKHKIIYETNHPFYKDNGRKDKAWHLIAAILGVDGEYKVLLKRL